MKRVVLVQTRGVSDPRVSPLRCFRFPIHVRQVYPSMTILLQIRGPQLTRVTLKESEIPSNVVYRWGNHTSLLSHPR